MAGIYVHIPFCKQQCSYCDFHFSTTFEAYRSEMISGIIKEIELRNNYLEKKVIETIYFGGGTPSLLNGHELKSILASIHGNFTVSSSAEVTLEANPDDIDEEKLNAWKENGITRLSIGLQSFKASDLQWMNRTHSVEEGLSCIQLAQQFGFDNLTVDLIYGLPDLSESEWTSHIQTLIDLKIPHISAYCLTVEKNTALIKMVKDRTISVGDEDEQAEQFQLLVSTLKANNYIQYEISNFSEPGFESQHNSNYWKGEYYLGIGPSAHSYNGTQRRWNVANNQKYIKAISVGDAYSSSEILSNKDRFNEHLLLGLRTLHGADLQQLSYFGSVGKDFKERYSTFLSNGWLREDGNNLLLTEEGKLRADYIASELFIVD